VGTSDEALLAGLANGDREAAAAFVRRFQKRVYGLALGIVGDAGTAEDVAQEAFTRAWRRADGYDARRGRVLTWLLTITRSTAIDVVRLRRAQPMDPELLTARLQLEQDGGATRVDRSLADHYAPFSRRPTEATSLPHGFVMRPEPRAERCSSIRGRRRGS